MSLPDFDLHTRQLFGGNIALIVCCLFYLWWWAAAFHPRGAPDALHAATPLLVAAMAAGILSVTLTALGITSAPREATLFPPHSILWGGVAVYLILLATTALLLRRQVTTELFLIVGWAMLELSQLDALYGAGRFGLKKAMIFSAVVILAAAISLVCYLKYYRLEAWAGYIDGMIPLILVAAVMAALTAALAVSK